MIIQRKGLNKGKSFLLNSRSKVIREDRTRLPLMEFPQTSLFLSIILLIFSNTIFFFSKFYVFSYCFCTYEIEILWLDMHSFSKIFFFPFFLIFLLLLQHIGETFTNIKRFSHFHFII